MTYRTKYPEVEQMLQKYSRAPKWIEENEAIIGEKRNAERVFKLKSPSNISGLPRGTGTSDPVSGYIQYIEELDESADRLSAENAKLESFIREVEQTLKECLNEDEREIILLKYKERQTHKQIIWKKKISNRTLFNLINNSYAQIYTKLHNSAQDCTKLHNSAQ